jgi:hypothetical protein
LKTEYKQETKFSRALPVLEAISETSEKRRTFFKSRGKTVMMEKE